jgi:hypothetical protein
MSYIFKWYIRKKYKFLMVYKNFSLKKTRHAIGIPPSEHGRILSFRGTIGRRAALASSSQLPSFQATEAIPLASPGKSINQVKPNC